MEGSDTAARVAPGRSGGWRDHLRRDLLPRATPFAGTIIILLGWVLYLFVALGSAVAAYGAGDELTRYFFFYHLMGRGLVAAFLVDAILLTLVGLFFRWQWEDHLEKMKLKERFANLVTFSPEGIMALDPQGYCLYANGALAHLLGYSLGELKEMIEARAPLQRYFGNPTARLLEQAHTSLARDSPLYNLDLELHTHHGRVPVLASMAWAGDRETILLLKDMREFEATQALLRLFYNAFKHANEAIVITDTRANIVEVNNTFLDLYGYDRNELLGQNPRLIKSGKTPDKTYQELWLGLTTKGFWTGRLINQTHDGTQVPVMLSVSAIHDEEDKLQGYLGFSVNLTHQVLLEQEVVDTDLRYRNLVENSADLIFTLDEELNLTFANEQFRQQLGLDPEQLLDTPFEELVSPAERKLVRKLFGRGLKANAGEADTAPFEEPLSLLDGQDQPNHFIVVGAYMRDELERIVGLGAIARNVTRETQLIHELSQSEARHRELLEHMLDMIFQVDSLGQLTYVNPAFAQFFGYESDETALDTSMLALFQNPQEWQRLQDLLLEQDTIENYQHAMQRLDGTPVTVSSQMRTITSQTGDLLGVEGSIRDMTAQAALERKAREMALFAQMDPAPVLRLDDTGRVVLANPAALELLGQEVTGRSWTELFPDSPDPCLLLEEGTEQVAWETPIGDHHYLFNFRTYPQEGLLHLYGLDLTARKNLERERERLLAKLKSINSDLEQEVTKRTERLIQSEKMAALGHLVAGVAHEINNPLGFLKANLTNFTEYFEELQGLIEASRSLEPPEAVTRQLKYYGKVIEHGRNESMACQEGVERIADITRSLRLFAHPKEEKLAPTDLNEGLKHSMVLLRPALQDIRVEMDLQPLPLVLCNGGQVNQVVMNLLTNAIQALQGQGEIKVRTFQEGPWVCLEVVDDGPGIAQEELKHIFEPFFTTKPEGTGLGLSISYRIVNNHNGRLEVDTALGQGTTMRLKLPQEGPQKTPVDNGL